MRIIRDSINYATSVRIIVTSISIRNSISIISSSSSSNSIIVIVITIATL